MVKIKNKNRKKIQIKNLPMFLLIGLIAFIIILLLIYFLFLYYSPEMILKYSGYAIESKTMVENLKSDNVEAVQKYINLVDVQEQAMIYKRLNNYYVGDTKEEIDINYPIYLNDGNVILNLSDVTKLITVNFEIVEGYPDFMLTGGIMYNGDDLTRADGNEYIFLKTNDDIYINVVKIKIDTSFNTYEISEYSNIYFNENYITYYEQKDNYLEYHRIGDIDNNSIITLNNQEITYRDLLEKLEMIENEEDDDVNGNVIEENTINELVEEDVIENEVSNVTNQEIIIDNNDNNANDDNINDSDNNNDNTWQEGEWAKPEVSCTDFVTDVYSTQTNVTINDKANVISKGVVFEFLKEGRINRRTQVTTTGEIEIIGLEPDTEYEIIGKVYYLDENGLEVEEQFYNGIIHTLSLDTLGTINFNFENGDIYSNKIEIKNLMLLNELTDEVIQGISRIRVQIDGISYNLSTDQVNSLKAGESIVYQTGETVDSNKTINYEIKAYDKYNNELNVENNTGETRTSKESPSVNINVTKQDITEVNINIQLKNEDNVELHNYIYIITNQRDEIVKQGSLDGNTNKLIFTDLNPSDYFRIDVYADFDLNDGKGLQTDQILGTGSFVTQPISSLGYMNFKIEEKEVTSNSIFVGISIDDTKTDLRLITMLFSVNTILTAENGETHTIQLTQDEINSLKIAEVVNLRFEQLSSNTKYTIKIEPIVKQGTVEESIQTTQNIQEITTPKLPAEVQLRNQFIVEDMIDIDFRVEDLDGSVLTDVVRVELRDEQDKLISLEEIETNQDFERKIYNDLVEDTTYKLIFYAPEYNEGQTDSTYKSDYIIKEVELYTEEGISGTIDLQNIQRATIGKNLIDVNSKVNWYYKCFGNWDRSYPIKYNEETNILTLGNINQDYWNYYLYDFSDYIGETVTISFSARTISEETIDAFQLYGDQSIWYYRFSDLTNEWQEYSYTFIIRGNGYVGFYTGGYGQFEVQNLQVELGNYQTSYEPFQYNLQANMTINLIDKRNEITTNDYYIRIYKNGEQIDERRYEEIGEDNKVDGVRKSYIVEENASYKIELLVKILDRYYTLDYQEFQTGDSTEIKGISTVDEFLKIQPYGYYIVLSDLDLSGLEDTDIRFGAGDTNYIAFDGRIDFNGKTVTRGTVNSTSQIFVRIGENALIENLVLNIKIDRDIETTLLGGLVRYNFGTIRNLQVNLIESTRRQNSNIFLLCDYNYGTVENFILNFEESLYVLNYTSLIQRNYGIVRNGYVYGENIKAIFDLPQDMYYELSTVVTQNRGNGIVENIFSLVNIDLNTSHEAIYEVGNIVYVNRDNATVQNVYSVGIGQNTTNFYYGPNVYYIVSEKINNSFYFTDEIFINEYNIKGNKLSLWDSQFQNQLINTSNAFEVDSLVSQGYYPQLNLPDVMPTQEYIPLIEVDDADLPDILSTKVIEQGSTSVKVEFSVNNPAAEQIEKIEIANVTTNILSQTYSDGRSIVVAELVDPIVYVSQYNVLSIHTKGAFNTTYTRTYSEGERTIYVDLYREIWNVNDWKGINNSPTENYMLMADLDFIQEGNTIQIKEIHGILNGNNHTISNIILTENVPLINELFGNIIDLNINNFRQEATTAGGIIETSYVGSVIDNVHVQGLEIIKTENGYAGGLISYGETSIIRNSSIINLNIDVQITDISNQLAVGGILGLGENSTISNCYVQNLDISNKNAVIAATGGISGGDTEYTNIDNCYAIGEINAEGVNTGGIIGLFSSGEVTNSYSMVDIYSTNQFVGGIIGTSEQITESSLRSAVNNNLSIGNIYTTQGTDYLNRIIGNTNETASNNYAYINQQINGFTSEETLGATLLGTDGVLELDLGEYYSYEGSINGLLPKLYNTELTELLKNQQDNLLQEEIELNIERVDATKINTTEAEITVLINNSNEVEITEIEIEDMTYTITRNVTQNGLTSIELKATPEKYYDSYRISKIKYKNGDTENEIEVNAEVQVQFYKELYTFEDWQSIEIGTYQNYRLMNDIDFSGRSNIKTNVTMNRLEAENNIYYLQNINLEFNENNTGLIQNIRLSMKNIGFENIILKNTSSSGEHFGLIAINNANIENLEFLNITIQGENINRVGIISEHSSGNITKVRLNNINVLGTSYTGGLIGSGAYLTSNITISDIEASDLTVIGYDDVGGVIGAIAHLYVEFYDVTISDSYISGRNDVGGVLGYGPGKYLNSINNTIVGSYEVGGIAGALDRNDNLLQDLTYLTVDGCHIESTGGRSGGIAGNIDGSSDGYLSVINTTIEGTSVNANNIGGIVGHQNTWTIQLFQVEGCSIISKGRNVGGVVGTDTSWQSSIRYGYVNNTIVEGESNVGGLAGYLNWSEIYYVSVNANVTAISYSAGGLVGYLENGEMTATIHKTKFNSTMLLDSTIKAPAKAGGFIGEIQKEIYRDSTFYFDNYIHAEVICDDPETSSLIIGSNPSENAYIENTYVYRYSLLNGEYVFNTTDVIETSQYLIGEDLRNQSTYSNIIGSRYFDISCINDEVYPKIFSNYVAIPEEIGIVSLPIDPTSTNNIQNNTNNSISEIATQSIQELPNITYYPISAYEFNIDFSNIPDDTTFIYSINGQEIEEIKLEAKTYTFRYNYQDTIELKIKNSNNENTITITPNNLISKISLVNDTISYISNNILYINGNNSGEYLNVYKGNALSKDGNVLDTTTNSIIISEKIETKLEEEAKPQNTYVYNGNDIKVYGTYSTINGSVKAQIYTVKNGKLSAISNNLNMKIGNIVTDNFNEKEYQTILNSDGELEDLKEKLNYPENFLNSNITQLVQNESTEKTQAMVYYESGKVVVFDYVTGEIIYENEIENNIGLFNYIADSFSNIWSDYEDKQKEYQYNMELMEKLEETPIEKALEQLNVNHNTNTISNEGVDINIDNINQDSNNFIANNTNTNNISSNNNYITVYNPETNSYEVYSENEILTGEEEEPVSENKKIQLNGLQNFYNYEVSRESNEVNGVIIISGTIIVVILSLIVLRRYVYIKRKKVKKNNKTRKTK